MKISLCVNPMISLPLKALTANTGKNEMNSINKEKLFRVIKQVNIVNSSDVKIRIWDTPY